MRAKKSLGQNFLMHGATATRIAGAAGVSKEDTVLEVGPGTGMLTRALLATGARVCAIEADRELIPVLEVTFSAELTSGQLTLIEGDAREADLSTLGAYKVVANIPYYITGELIRFFLSAPVKPSSMTLLLQKEVAERIARSTKESILSLSVKVYGAPKIAFAVPRGAFTPAPSVDSAVLVVENIRSPFDTNEEEQRFFAIVKAGFAQKRKRLMKNLEVVESKEKIAAAFSGLELSEDARAEDVPLHAWTSLVKHLS